MMRFRHLSVLLAAVLLSAGLAVLGNVEVDEAERQAESAQEFAPARGLGGEIEHRVL